MIQYITLQEQVDADFDHARRQAVLRRIANYLLNRPSPPPSFEEQRRFLGSLNQVSCGIEAVEIGKISGSVGRHRDFDSAFLPARTSVATRWKRVDQAFHRAEELPPVSLYKLGGSYFVRGGNHRVSVACYHGAKMIDAEVVELLPRTPASPTPPPPIHSGWLPRLKDRIGSLQPRPIKPDCEPCGR